MGSAFLIFSWVSGDVHKKLNNSASCRGIRPQYHLPELPRINKSKIGFNWAPIAGSTLRFDRRGKDIFVQLSRGSRMLVLLLFSFLNREGR